MDMDKEFDQWNEVKKSVHSKPDNFGIHEREIWWLSLGVNVGVETDGKHSDFERPVLVLRKFNRQMVWILPITSRGKDARFYEKFLFDDREYFTVLTQLRTVSTKRFLRKIGMMAQTDFERIKRLMISFIQIDEDSRLSESSRRPKP